VTLAFFIFIITNKYTISQKYISQQCLYIIRSPTCFDIMDNVDYVKRYCCDIYFCDINCAFVGYNKNINKCTVHMHREEKPTRCHWMLYCTYDMLNMFRAFLCPSSGVRDYVCVITAYGMQCLVAGCWGSGTGQQAMRPGRGMLHDCVVSLLTYSLPIELSDRGFSHW